MSWPWQTKKPVFDPTRNYDIHTIIVDKTWTHPVQLSYIIPDNFWAQILSVSFKVVAAGGIPPAAGKMALLVLHQGRPLYNGWNYVLPASNRTSYFTWTIAGFMSEVSSSLYRYNVPLPDHLYVFPNDEITIVDAGLRNGDVFSELMIQLKRWEFY